MERKLLQLGLTLRQCEVCMLIKTGLTNPQIAEKLHVSIDTVKAHAGMIYRKLQVKNRMELIIKILLDNFD